MEKEEKKKSDKLELESWNRKLKEELLEVEKTLKESDKTQEEKPEKKRKTGKKGIRNKKKRSLFNIIIICLCVLAALLLLVIGIFFRMKYQGEKALKEGNTDVEITAPVGTQVEEEGEFVVYKGERYWYNEDIITILCMGIDTSLQETGEDHIGQNGQADALFLAVIDTQKGEFSLVNISRDTMVDVKRYNVRGQYAGMKNMQVCLAYAYGDGREKSCENTMDAVSRLMYGMPIHAYAAIEYSGIGVLNDVIGGVRVQVLEDLSGADAALTPGAVVTLDGSQAHTYVRSRDTRKLDSNHMRMARQKQYLMSFIQQAISRTKQDISLPITLYQTAAQYMVTDVGTAEVTYLASMVLENGFSEGNMYSVPGQVIAGEKYAEFIPDEEGLYELILEVFYEKEKEKK